MSDLADPSERAEAVRRRLAFEADPVAFADQWRSAEETEAQRLILAREVLPRVKISPDVLQAISRRCLEAGTDGLRADLTMARAAAAWAAYQGRTEVKRLEVEAVAELALAHRRTRPLPPTPDRGNQESRIEDRGSKIEGRRSKPEDKRPPIEDRRSRIEDLNGSNHDGSRSPAREPRSSIFRSAGLFAPRPKPSRHLLERSNFLGRWRQGKAWRPGRPGGRLGVYQPGSLLSWAGTLRAAALFQVDRRPSGGSLIPRAEDLRGWPRRGPAGCLLLFVVDGSGSMGAWQRMRRTKSAVLSLLVCAYQRRDQVSMLVFRSNHAELILPPTRGLHGARRVLEKLPIGGTTPLAHALAESSRLARRQQRRQPRQPMWMVLLTDGRANVPIHNEDPWLDAVFQGRALAASGVHCLVVDTEAGWPRFGRAVELARVMGSSYVPLDEVLGRPLTDHWRQAV